VSFRIRTHHDPHRTIVEASGELDAYASPDLRHALHAVEEDDVVVCDLRGADFLDSTALGALVGSHRRASASGRRFAVMLPRGTASRIFRLTALDEVFTILDE
jgi:anti-sigma B factor antagonist